jgi:hypothetical protein
MGTCGTINPYDCSTWGEARSYDGDPYFWNSEYAPQPLNGIAANGADVHLLVGDGGAMHRWVPPGGMTQAGGAEGDLLPGGAVTANGNLIVSAHAYDYFFDPGGEYSILLRSTDAGATWVSTHLWNLLVHDVAFPPGAGPTSPLYGAGFDARNSQALINRSFDGGVTWSTLWVDATFPALNALTFESSTNGIAVGEDGTVARIDNDVISATQEAPGASLRGVAFPSTDVVVAVGAMGPAGARIGVVVRSSDGGHTWAPVTNGATDWLNGVGFATASIGIAVGTRGAILRSLDAGQTWTPLTPVTSRDLFGVRFTDALHGYACGGGGVVLETFDAGVSWTPLQSLTNKRLTDIEPLATASAYFGGDDSTVLRYLQSPVPTLISAFDASASSFEATLSWRVHDVVDLDHFDIARSTRDGGFMRTSVSSSQRSFKDTGVTPGERYEYTLIAVERSGDEIFSAPVMVTIPAARAELLPNVPNPFNPSTTLRYVVPARSHVTLAIYDVAGRLVTTLVDTERTPGVSEIEWNGTDANGNPVASGVYVSRLTVGKAQVSRTLVLLK